jgi:DnaJ-class molecular chaperone
MSLAEDVQAWANALDRMDYFQVLRIPRASRNAALDYGELRKAFSAFASSFHPDRFRNESPTTREHVTAIFRLGNEAYRVLNHPQLRVRYMNLLATGVQRMCGDEIARSVSSGIRPAVSAAPPAGSIAGLAKDPRSATWARLADAALARGDKQEARLQLQLVLAKEPDNLNIHQKLAELEAEPYSSRPSRQFKVGR